MGRARESKGEEKGDSEDDLPLKEVLTRRATLRDTSSSPKKSSPKKASPNKALTKKALTKKAPPAKKQEELLEKDDEEDLL